jgi:type 1 glutamine amidotransferase
MPSIRFAACRFAACSLVLLALGACASSRATSAPPPPPPEPALGEPAVLIFTRSTGYVHKSTPTAALAIGKAATSAGLTADISDNPAYFTPASLRRYRAVVLLATAGEPLGSPEAVAALIAYVHGGGGLVGIENATNAHVKSREFVALLGAVFNGHPGGVRTTTCEKQGDHPSVTGLPASITVTDEIYVFKDMRADNQVVLRCGDADNKVPVAWYRQEGAGRIFFSALGHRPEQWNEPPLVDGHVLPGILWAMGLPSRPAPPAGPPPAAP